MGMAWLHTPSPGRWSPGRMSERQRSKTRYSTAHGAQDNAALKSGRHDSAKRPWPGAASQAIQRYDGYGVRQDGTTTPGTRQCRQRSTHWRLPSPLLASTQSARLTSCAAHQQRLGLATNGQPFTPNAVPRTPTPIPEGLRAVENRPHPFPETTQTKETRE